MISVRGILIASYSLRWSSRRVVFQQQFQLIQITGITSYTSLYHLLSSSSSSCVFGETPELWYDLLHMGSKVLLLALAVPWECSEYEHLICSIMQFVLWLQKQQGIDCRPVISSVILCTRVPASSFSGLQSKTCWSWVHHLCSLCVEREAAETSGLRFQAVFCSFPEGWTEPLFPCSDICSSNSLLVEHTFTNKEPANIHMVFTLD